MFVRIRYAIGLLLMVTTASQAVQTNFSDSGATPGDLNSIVGQFQAALGEPNNGNAAGPIAAGRRQINWDAGVVPFDMPGDFFNNVAFPPTRGAVFSTNAGNEFRVSNDTGGLDNEFDSLNSSYPDEFQPFSNDRIFTPVNTNVTDVKFFVPATNIPATVKGFAAIFTDVDMTGSSQIDYYDLNNNLIGSIQPTAEAQGLSFAGATFDNEEIYRVRITSGNTAITDIGSPDDNPSLGIDVVAFDDFLYSEPQAIPEPTTVALLSLAFVGLASRSIRSRRK